MGEVDELLENPAWRIVFDLVQAQINRAEKAHPLIPSDVIRFVEEGFGRTLFTLNGREIRWHFLFYLPEDELIKIFNKRLEKWIEYYENLWDAWEKLGSRFEPVPELTSFWIESSRSEVFLNYTVTSNREMFEKVKDYLKDCKTLEELKEKLGVSKVKSDL